MPKLSNVPAHDTAKQELMTDAVLETPGAEVPEPTGFARLGRSNFVLFLAWFALILLLKWPTLTQPPVWDGSMSVFPAAITLAENDFDLGYLLEQPGYADGGPNVHSVSLVTWLTAGIIWLLGDTSALFPLIHLVHFAIAAATMAGLYRFAKPLLCNVMSATALVAVLLFPLVLTQAGYMYLEFPMLAATTFALLSWTGGRLAQTTFWSVAAVLIKGAGIIVPAAIFYLLNSGDSLALQGWAIPTATDIAFALAVLAMVGNMPTALKLFLMTLAIIDDLGAILIIALFYTAELSIAAMLAALMCIAALVWLKLKGVLRIAPYLIVGAVLWVSVLKSGVHATIAGVLLGFFIPLGDENSEDGSPLQNLLHDLHPWVAFGILPLFAFVNGGVSLEGMSLRSLLEPVPLGIVLGLFLGKQIGVFSFAWLSIKTGIAKLPDQVSMAQIYGTAVLCGVGFTMSLFISSLAYEEVGVGYAQSDRLGIIFGS